MEEKEDSDIIAKTNILKQERQKLIGFIGNCVGIFFNKQGVPVFTIGPHWPFCGFLILLFSLVDGLFVWILEMPGWLKWLGFFVMLSFLFSFLGASLINPGIQIRQDEQEMEDLEQTDQADIRYQPKYCKACKVVKQKGTWHCEDCDLCVMEFDHHCPWTGKCIGGRNLIFFYMFLFSVFANLIYCILAVTAATSIAHRKK